MDLRKQKEDENEKKKSKKRKIGTRKYHLVEGRERTTADAYQPLTVVCGEMTHIDHDGHKRG